MLQSLRISNLAIVDALTVEFGTGFNALTGETGAGKSILVDAINLVLGDRSNADLIRTGEETATVEALFTGIAPAAKAAAEAAGVEVDDELLIKRIVSRAGKNKVYLNGGPATLSMLQALGPLLIDIAGQHENQTLLLPDAQRDVVDAMGGHSVEKMAAAYADWRRAKRELDELAAKETDRARREDYLRFQVEELRKAEPKEGEEEALLAERERCQHAGALSEALAAADDALYSGDGAVASRVKAVHGRLAAAAKIDPRIAPYLSTLESCRLELEEAARSLRDLVPQGESDPDRLGEIEDRLVVLERLRKKHGVAKGPEGARALVEMLAGLEKDLAELASFEEAIAARKAAEEAARKAAVAAAAALTEARKKTARGLAAKIAEEVRALGMPHTRFEIGVSPEELSKAGADLVEFRIAPNPGEEMKPLAKTASGGELSRVMLAMKCVLAGRHPVASYVFDEVDAGIGGAVAERVGRKLAEVAGKHQVLCITHLPQVASLADAHVGVRKTVARGRTAIEVQRLEGAAREEELARMLGGMEITAATRAHAKEMLARTGARPEGQPWARRAAGAGSSRSRM